MHFRTHLPLSYKVEGKEEKLEESLAWFTLLKNTLNRNEGKAPYSIKMIMNYENTLTTVLIVRINNQVFFLIKQSWILDFFSNTQPNGSAP